MHHSRYLWEIHDRLLIKLAQKIAAELALSIRQPWAWLIVAGHKPVENREWRTSHRGRIQIHAAKTLSVADYLACRIFIDGFSRIDLPPMAELYRGGIVGEADLVACVDQMDLPWFTGPYGFVLRNARAVAPIACHGMPGLFDPCKLHPHFQDPPKI